MTVLRFTVLGKPQPAGSKRALPVRKGGVPTGQIAVIDANPRAKSWQQEVRAVAREAFVTAYPYGSLLDGPLELRAWFYTPRPRSHYRTGRFAHLLRDDAPTYLTTRPDTTKLLRGLEDALTGVVWHDDAQVVVQTACKTFGEPARTMVEVRRLPVDGLTSWEGDVMATPHILDLVGRALPDALPGRGDAWVAVTWSTDDPAVLHRLAREHPFGDLEPGEYIMWRDPGRHLIVQVSYVSDDDDGGDTEPAPDPSWRAAA